MDVAVVGGGVVGLSAALDLARNGAEVVLLERGTCGAEASQGNAGWITLTLSTPLAEPGAAAHALGAMTSPRSPFVLRPRLDPAFAAWGWRFWRASTAARWRRGAADLLALNGRTLALYDELREHGVAFEMHETGVLFLGCTPNGLDGIRKGIDALVALGYDGVVEELSREQVHEREPALADGVLGGIHARGERHVRPESLVRGLAEAATRAGVRIVEGAHVERIARCDGGWSLTASGEEHRTRRVLIAAGSVSHTLLRPLGVRLPLEGAKGYSVTATGTGAAPRHALYLTEEKVAFTPFDGAARLAGTLELGARDTKLRRHRLDGIVASSARYLRDWRPEGNVVELAGVRPLAADGLPLIGGFPGLDGLYVATGHGMLGVTLAPATASALTPLMLEDRLLSVLEPFRPDRFSRRAHHA